MGLPLMIDNCVIPVATALLMYSSWDVSPLITQPKHMTLSELTDFSKLLAATGSSKAPGTLMISISDSVTPTAIKVSFAPERSLDVTSVFQSDTTICILKPSPEGQSSYSDRFFLAELKA